MPTAFTVVYREEKIWDWKGGAGIRFLFKKLLEADWLYPSCDDKIMHKW